MQNNKRTEESRKPREKKRNKKQRNKKPLARLNFYGVVFYISDDDDPDEVVERYVASGKHEHLEKTDPQLAIDITRRFVEHQQWREEQEKKRKDKEKKASAPSPVKVKDQ